MTDFDKTGSYILGMRSLMREAEGLPTAGADGDEYGVLFALCTRTGETAGGGMKCRTRWFCGGNDMLLTVILADFAGEYPDIFEKAAWLVEDRRRKAEGRP